jgi:hypothetical protein
MLILWGFVVVAVVAGQNLHRTLIIDAAAAAAHAAR